jgi:hypothetical protein
VKGANAAKHNEAWMIRISDVLVGELFARLMLRRRNRSERVLRSL